MESGLWIKWLLAQSLFYPHVLSTRSSYYQPHYCLHQESQSFIAVLVPVDSCVNLHAECGDSVQSEIRERGGIRRLGSLFLCPITIQQRQTDPAFGAIVITDSEKTLKEKTYRHKR